MKNTKPSRRKFIQNTLMLAGTLPLAPSLVASEQTTKEAKRFAPLTQPTVTNHPSMAEADGKLRFDFGKERMILDGGLQPFMLCTAAGTFVLQAQSPNPPFPTARMHYPYMMATVISRDEGKTWKEIPLKPNDNGLNLEGGAVQLKDGTILALDTYIIPGKKPGEGIGQLYTSTDDWKTMNGPEDVTFDLPNVNFYASKDDGGHPHDAQRLHRKIIELANGDLLTTFYGQLFGDNTPSTYTPTMMKSRVMLVRSSNKGQHWKLVSTVAVDPSVGTEGFGEPVLVRVSKGKHAGRLICFMRTGRELYEAFSDNEGKTWSKARPRTFAGVDINRTELWVDMFRNIKGRSGKMLDENNPNDLKGAVVDPDLIELRSGLLVAAFGVRVPQKACWPNAWHPWNGNYVAVSNDNGTTWKNVVRMTSGVLTTHYMAVQETKNDNEVFVTYDYGYWNKNSSPARYVYGRMVKIIVK